MLGLAAGSVGVAVALSGQSGLGVVAGGLGLAAGLLGWRARHQAPGPNGATGPSSAVSADEDLSEELALARLREHALNQRIDLLERVARAGGVGADAALTLGLDRSGLPFDGSGFQDDRDPQDLLSDPETGLFSQAYFDVALEARIAAARRRLRPVALVLLDIVRGLASDEAEPADAGLVTIALRRTLREADTACRLDDGRFALVLEDTPENGAIWTVERIRGHLVESGVIHTVWAGVACYPAHAFDRDEIMNQANEALTQAKEWRQDRIEVASAD
ncbi:MAG: diguanylate cyclase domain-containing protein [Acidimicrobiales bacterium]